MKLSASVIGFILAMAIVTAIWVFSNSFTGNVVYEITSDSPNLTILKELVNESLDTSNSSISFNDTIEFLSTKRGNAIIGLNVVKTDINDSCFDYINDCELHVYSDGIGYGFSSEIFDGSNISIDNMQVNRLRTALSCVQYSCPQRITLDLDVTLE